MALRQEIEPVRSSTSGPGRTRPTTTEGSAMPDWVLGSGSTGQPAGGHADCEGRGGGRLWHRIFLTCWQWPFASSASAATRNWSLAEGSSG
jgi:hypothetical protein